MSFDDLGVDGLLEALSFMNAQCLARVACTHRLGAVSAHEAQQKPALLVVKGSLQQVAKDLREKMAARPNIAFLEYIHEGVDQTKNADIMKFLEKQLPRETVVLGACTNSLLCALHRECAPAAGTVLEVADEDLCADHIALLVATLPEAKANVFTMKSGMNLGLTMDDSSDYSDSGYEDSDHQSNDRAAIDAEEMAELEEEEGRLEGSHVQASAQVSDGDHEVVVGQTCQSGDSSSGDWLSSLEQAGYRSQQAAPVPEAPQKDTTKTQMQQLLSLDPPPSIVVIQDARNNRGLVAKVQATYPQAAIIGGCAMGGEIMVKDGLAATCEDTAGIGILAISGNAPLFALTSPFTGSPKTAEEDVRSKMALAEKLASDEERRVLGSLLFTCCARNSSLFGREASDVIWFQERFPNLPLLGMYAGGEIGPKGKTNSNLQSFEHGNAQYQGYTAVFGFFLVPRKHAPSLLFQRAVLYGEVREAFSQLFAAR